MARSRRTTAGLVLVATITLGAGPAFAQSPPTIDGGNGTSQSATAGITAALTAGGIGSRTITTISPLALTSALGSDTLSATLAVVVAEAARSGTNAWSVTAISSALTSGANTLAASNLSVDNRSVAKVAGGGTAAAPDVELSSPLNAAATLFSNSGQSASSIYTGTYTGTSTVTLAVPNGSATGAYTGTLTVTLVQ